MTEPIRNILRFPDVARANRDELVEAVRELQDALNGFIYVQERVLRQLSRLEGERDRALEELHEIKKSQELSTCREQPLTVGPPTSGSSNHPAAGEKTGSHLATRKDSPEATEQLHAHVPNSIAESLAAFRNDLAYLLKKAQGKWAAYHGKQRIGIASDERSLYEKCFRCGLSREEFVVRRVTAQTIIPDVTPIYDD